MATWSCCHRKIPQGLLLEGHTTIRGWTPRVRSYQLWGGEYRVMTMWENFCVWVESECFCVFLYPPRSQHKLKPQWFLAAYWAWSDNLAFKEREGQTVKRHTVGRFLFLQTTRQIALCYCSPPLLSSRPSFSTQLPQNSLSLFFSSHLTSILFLFLPAHSDICLPHLSGASNSSTVWVTLFRPWILCMQGVSAPIWIGF